MNARVSVVLDVSAAFRLAFEHFQRHPAQSIAVIRCVGVGVARVSVMKLSKEQRLLERKEQS